MSAERSAIVLGSTSSETAYLVSRMKPRVGILAICQSIDACLAKASDMGVPRAIFVESGHDIGGLAEALRSSRIRTTLIAFGRTGTQGAARPSRRARPSSSPFRSMTQFSTNS